VSPGSDQSIRPFLSRLERAGELLHINKPVDPRYEISAFLSAADSGPALVFDQVTGSELKVVGNVLTSRARVAAALDIRVDEILSALHTAIRQPLAPQRVAAAPVQEVVIRESPLANLPVPTFFQRESRPYITAGTILARDPDSGRGNLSFARLAILDERTAMIGIAPNHHLALFARDRRRDRHTSCHSTRRMPVPGRWRR
jgi:2,5-furandicarboxylate decarboxylase 1